MIGGSPRTDTTSRGYIDAWNTSNLLNSHMYQYIPSGLERAGNIINTIQLQIVPMSTSFLFSSHVYRYGMYWSWSDW